MPRIGLLIPYLFLCLSLPLGKVLGLWPDVTWWLALSPLYVTGAFVCGLAFAIYYIVMLVFRLLFS